MVPDCMAVYWVLQKLFFISGYQQLITSTHTSLEERYSLILSFNHRLKCIAYLRSVAVSLPENFEFWLVFEILAVY